MSSQPIRIEADTTVLNAETASLNARRENMKAADAEAVNVFNGLVSAHNERVDAATSRWMAFNKRVDAYHEMLAKAAVPVR